MSNLLTPYAHDRLVERGDTLTTLIEKVSTYAPMVAEQMELLDTFSGQVTEDRLVEFADQALDLRRSNLSTLIALLHDGAISLGSLLTAIDLDEWLGEDEATGVAHDALHHLIEALATISARIRPNGRGLT